MTDNGAKALARAVLVAAQEHDRRPTSDRFEWYSSADEMAAAILATGAVFLPDGLPRDFHKFHNIDPEAPCPVCGFPAWSHDPGMAVLNARQFLTAEEAELTVIPPLPPANPSLMGTTQNGPTTTVSELERLRRIEAAARLFMDRPGSETAERAALRAAITEPSHD